MFDRRLASLLCLFTLAGPLALADAFALTEPFALTGPFALTHQGPRPDPVRRPALAPNPDPADLVLRADLRDDDVPGNAGAAYGRLRRRGAAARPALVLGLRVLDWQERLLSAALLAQLPAGELTVDELDELARTLVGHLGDNRIRGDARLAANALVVIGQPVRPYVQASAWHAEPQLADLCMRIERTLSSNLNRRSAQHLSRSQLARPYASLAWTGAGPAVAPPPAGPLPDAAESLRRGLVDLGADDREGNAYRAWLVFHGWVGRAWARPFEAEDPGVARLLRVGLHGALADPDRQRRQLVGHVLMSADELPTRALLAVAIEALDLDAFGSSTTVPAANANRAGTWLLAHLDEAGPELLGALWHPSHAVRVRAAALLAQGRHPAHPAYVPLLIQHLADNDIEDDATLAGRSLVLLGPAARPWLDRRPVDEQQAAYLDLIRRAITVREIDPDARLPFSYGGMYGLERRERR